MKRTIVCVLVACVLAGCGAEKSVKKIRIAESFSIVDQRPKYFGVASLSSSEQQAKGDADNDKELEDKLAESLVLCGEVLGRYESKADSQAKWGLAVSLTGLVAGAVLAPALTAANAANNAKYIAGLSGLAGSTNVASRAVENAGLDGKGAAETRNRIVTGMQTQVAIAVDGKKPFEERKAAILGVRAACVVYAIAVPGRTDIEIVKSDNKDASDPQPAPSSSAPLQH